MEERSSEDGVSDNEEKNVEESKEEEGLFEISLDKK